MAWLDKENIITLLQDAILSVLAAVLNSADEKRGWKHYVRKVVMAICGGIIGAAVCISLNAYDLVHVLVSVASGLAGGVMISNFARGGINFSRRIGKFSQDENEEKDQSDDE